MTCAKELKLGTIIYSTQNEASLNIIRHLEQDWNWKKQNDKLYTFSACGKKDCCTGVKAIGWDKNIIEIEPEIESNYFLYASPHKSEKQLPTFTAHYPGNWSDAGFGGDAKTLNIAYACKLKQILKFLHEKNSELELGWQVCAEVDHHGPTLKNKDLPLIFVEIGSTQKEWGNEIAGKIVAEAMFKSLLRTEPKYPTYIAFGGGHYAPKFTDFILGRKLLDSQEIAISHICPKYKIDEIDEHMIVQAIQKTLEPVCGALIDKKGLSKEQRTKVEQILQKHNIKTIYV